MCGRYNLTAPPEAVREMFGYDEQPNFPPRENISPTEPIAVVRARVGKPEFALMRWGLIPSWAKNPADLPRMFNARAESAAEKPSFRSAMKRRRCLIPATGFYEWQKTGPRTKLPHHIRRPDGGVFALAGLWECWSDPQGGEIDTATILTTAANETLAPLHDRMPVIIPPEAFARWFNTADCGPAEVRDLLVPAPAGYLEAHAMPRGGSGKAPLP